MVRRISQIVGALLVAQANCFTTNYGRPLQSTHLQMVLPPGARAGSFFNPVPGDDENNKDKEEPQTPLDFDDEVGNLLRQRRKPPIASNPSTVNGVPTSKPAGFGKINEAVSSNPSSKKPFTAVGPPDKPLNDVTKPEYDDQGYTLYADESTGKKSRVFEALVDYPCDFTMKIVGMKEGSFVEEMVALVAEACETEPSNVPYSTRAVGKWTSISVNAPVKSADMLYALYEKVDLDPRVKFKF
jgi:putative lipoic acid-binding regulatory protein